MYFEIKQSNNISMKKYIIIAIMALVTFKSNAQMDSVRYGILNISPEVGMFFPRNENFQNLYNAKSYFIYSVGVDFGTSKWTYRPWFRFTGMTVENNLRGVASDSIQISAIKKEYTFGIIRPYRIRSNDYIELKLGLTYNVITESTANIDAGVFGYVFSVGYLHRIDKYVSYYVDLSNDYARVNSSSNLREWSGFRMDIGISVNLGVSAKQQHPVYYIQ